MKDLRKVLRAAILPLAAVVLVTAPAAAQVPAATPAPAPKLSELLSKNLESYDPRAEVPRERREQAYAKLMEGQRFIWRSNPQRGRSGTAANVRQARAAIVKALELDPGLAEGYTALAELSVSSPPSDVDEAIALATMATRLKKDNFGGHRILARLYTFKSRLNSGTLDQSYTEKAIAEWREVARLDPRNAEAWAFLSEFYDRTGRQDERIEALRKWLSSSPPLENQFYRTVMGGREDLSPEGASIKLGAALLKAGRIQEAIEVLSQVVADEPDNSEAIDLLKQAVESADPKVSAIAIEALQQAAYANSGNLSLLQLLAETQVRAGSLDEGVRVLADASAKFITTDRVSAAALQVSIGDLYAGADKLNEAAAAYQEALTARGLDKALTVDSDEREFALAVFEKLITVYKRSNRIADARAAIARARKLLGKDDLFADKQLISLYRETGRRSQALSVLRAVRLKNRDDIGLLRMQATILAESGQVDRAVALMKQRPPAQRRRATAGAASSGPVLTVGPSTYDEFSNYLFISQLYSDSRRGKDAVAAAQHAYSIAQGNERRQIAKLMVATAQQMAGNFAAAEATLRAILKETPGNPIALNNLGYFLLERGERFPEALEMIEQAIKVDPTNPSYLDSLGWAHFKLGRFAEAEKYLRDAARFDSSSSTIQEHLGDVYREQGKSDLARAAWQRALQLGPSGPDTARLRGKLASVK